MGKILRSLANFADSLNYSACYRSLPLVMTGLHRAADSFAAGFISKVAKQLLFFGLLSLFSAKIAGAQNATELTPKPELTPQQVVEYQLSAFQHNDEPSPDVGIKKAFRFASPANQQSVGPISRFISVVHSPGYVALLNSREAVVTKVQVVNDQARLLVRVLSASGSEVFFLFLLSKQSEGEVADCWMTDGVVGVQPADDGQPKVGI